MASVFAVREVWKPVITQTGLALGITIATTMTVVAQTATDRCKPGTIATLDIRPDSPIAWILFPVFAISIGVILCGSVAALVGMISLFFKNPAKRGDTAARLASQERFFFDPSFRINRLLIGWGFSSVTTVVLLLFVVGVIFGERC